MDTDEALTRCMNSVEVLRKELSEIEESFLKSNHDGRSPDPFTMTRYQSKSQLLIEQTKQYTELLKLKSPSTTSSSPPASESFPSVAKSISQMPSKTACEENNLEIEILVHNVSHSDLVVSVNNKGK